MTVPGLSDAPTANKKLLRFVEETAALTQPDRVVWCDGSQEEWDRLTQLLVDEGVFARLNEQLRPNSFLARSNPSQPTRLEFRPEGLEARPNRARFVEQPLRDPASAQGASAVLGSP